MLRALEPPTFEDPQRNQQARIIYQLVRLALVVCAPLALATWLFDLKAPSLPGILAVNLLLLAGYGALRIGYLRLAGALVTLGTIAVVTGVNYFNGTGVRSPGMAALFVVIVFAGMLVGEMLTLVTVIGGIGAMLILSWLEVAGLLPSPTRADVVGIYAPFYSALMILTGGVVTIYRRSIGRALAEVRAAAETQADVNRRLVDAADELRRRSAFLAAAHDTHLALMERSPADDLLRTILRSTAEMSSTPDAYLYLLEDGQLEMKVGLGIFEPIVGRRKETNAGLSGEIFTSGALCVVDDFSVWPHRTDWYPADFCHAVLGAPLTVGNVVRGVIGIAFTDPDRSIDADVIDDISRFAELVSVALHDTELRADMEIELAERQAAEADLRQHRLAMDASADGMAIFRDQRVVYSNAEYARLHGYENGEAVLGRRMEELFSSNEMLRFDEVVRPAIRNQGTYRGEGSVRLPNGRTIDLERSISAVTAGEYVSVIRDVTERRRTEAALRHSQKIESLGILAGGIAHDFNNLLTGVIGQLSLLQAQLEEEDPLRHAVDQAAVSSRRAAELTRMLLSYVGRGEVERGPLDLTALVRENVAIMKQVHPEPVVIEEDLESGPTMIEADPTQLHQVLLNLLMNAAEAVTEGRGTVTVSISSEILDRPIRNESAFIPDDIGPMPPGAYVRLEVSDNGVGMDKETIERIFDPFYSTKLNGRGLGLSATLGILRQHRAHLEVESVPGKGSTFRIRFPMQAKKDATTAVGGSEESDKGASSRMGPTEGTILVIDDEDSVREVAAEMLRWAGLTVLLAESGERGIEQFIASRAEIRLILLDVQMPGLGGAETLNRIREIDPDVPVLMSSGFSEQTAEEIMRDDQHSGFLQKPYTLDTFLDAVKAMLS